MSTPVAAAPAAQRTMPAPHALSDIGSSSLASSPASTVATNNNKNNNHNMDIGQQVNAPPAVPGSPRPLTNVPGSPRPLTNAPGSPRPLTNLPAGSPLVIDRGSSFPLGDLPSSGASSPSYDDVVQVTLERGLLLAHSHGIPGAGV